MGPDGLGWDRDKQGGRAKGGVGDWAPQWPPKVFPSTGHALSGPDGHLPPPLGLGGAGSACDLNHWPFRGLSEDSGRNSTAALGCLWVLWGWNPTPLGRDRTASSVAWPMSAPKATPRPNTATLALKLNASLLASGLIPPRCPISHLSVQVYTASPQGWVSVGPGTQPAREGNQGLGLGQGR